MDWEAELTGIAHFHLCARRALNHWRGWLNTHREDARQLTESQRRLPLLTALRRLRAHARGKARYRILTWLAKGHSRHHLLLKCFRALATFAQGSSRWRDALLLQHRGLVASYLRQFQAWWSSRRQERLDCAQWALEIWRYRSRRMLRRWRGYLAAQRDWLRLARSASASLQRRLQRAELMRWRLKACFSSRLASLSQSSFAARGRAALGRWRALVSCRRSLLLASCKARRLLLLRCFHSLRAHARASQTWRYFSDTSILCLRAKKLRVCILAWGAWAASKRLWGRVLHGASSATHHRRLSSALDSWRIWVLGRRGHRRLLLLAQAHTRKRVLSSTLAFLSSAVSSATRLAFASSNLRTRVAQRRLRAGLEQWRKWALKESSLHCTSMAVRSAREGSLARGVLALWRTLAFASSSARCACALLRATARKDRLGYAWGVLRAYCIKRRWVGGLSVRAARFERAARLWRALCALRGVFAKRAALLSLASRKRRGAVLKSILASWLEVATASRRAAFALLQSVGGATTSGGGSPNAPSLAPRLPPPPPIISWDTMQRLQAANLSHALELRKYETGGEAEDPFSSIAAALIRMQHSQPPPPTAAGLCYKEQHSQTLQSPLKPQLPTVLRPKPLPLLPLLDAPASQGPPGAEPCSRALHSFRLALTAQFLAAPF
jgi:hypothetical protein